MQVKLLQIHNILWNFIKITKSKKYPFSDGKLLTMDGSLVERDCLTGRCSFLGKPCPFSWARDIALIPITVHCSNITNMDLTVVSSSTSSSSLLPTSLPSSTSSIPSSSCCLSNTTASNFLQLSGPSCSFSSWAGVASYRTRQCRTRWSEYIRGGCAENEREVSRFCLVHEDCVLREWFTEWCHRRENNGRCSGSTMLCQ